MTHTLILACLVCVGAAADQAGDDALRVVPSKMCRGLFIVPVSWGEHTLEFVMDTGADGWSIDPDSLERVKKRRYRSGKKVTLRKGQAGPLNLKKIKARVHEMDHLALAIGVPIDGIRGVNTFSKVLLQLDYPQETIRAGKGALPEVDEVEVFRDFGKSRPFVRLMIGDTAVPVLIDSGSTGAIELHEDDPIGWAFEPTMVTMAVRYSSIELEYAGRLSSDLQFGPLRLVQPVTTLTSNTRLAGAQLLRHVVLTLDATNKRVRMVPAGDTDVEFEPYRSWGIGFRPRLRGMEVTGVFKNTPAEAAGIRKGDLLMSVDGVHVHDRGCRPIDDDTPQLAQMNFERDGQPFEVLLHSTILVP